MEIKLYFVRDYVCTGVVEHYFKTSILFTDEKGRKNVFSVIVNKKTGRVEKQASIDVQSLNKIIRKTIGYVMNNIPVIYDFNSLAVQYNSFTAEEKTLLNVCALDMQHSIEMGFKKVRNTQDDFTAYDYVFLTQFIRDFREAMTDIRLGRYTVKSFSQYEHAVPPTTNNNTETKIEEPKEDIENNNGNEEQEKQEKSNTAKEVSQSLRKTITMARMKNAEGLAEFVNGNVYRVKEKCNAWLNGNGYIPLYTDNGDLRFVKEDRIDVFDQFEEPPKQMN